MGNKKSSLKSKQAISEAYNITPKKGLDSAEWQKLKTLSLNIAKFSAPIRINSNEIVIITENTICKYFISTDQWSKSIKLTKKINQFSGDKLISAGFSKSTQKMQIFLYASPTSYFSTLKWLELDLNPTL